MRSTLCGFNDGDTSTGADLLVEFGPTMFVDVGFDPAYRGDGSAGQPHLAVRSLRALVDTGATTSCIDSQLAANLQLPIVDRARVSGVSGPREVNMHLAQIYVPALDQTIYGQFAGVDLLAGGQHHSVLIGRAFLRHFRMLYDGVTGTVMICDEVPALENSVEATSIDGNMDVGGPI